MKLSVLIPTYRRPDSLRRCLDGLQRQSRAVDEVVIATQAADHETQELLAAYPRFTEFRILQLTTPGAVAQYNAGLGAVRGDVVAITDDDTEPRPDWLLRIERHFRENADVGGLGGLDLVHAEGRILTGQARHVGVVRWFGRIVGNHHLGARFDRNVDVLKGANMAFRAGAIQGIRFDTDLKGAGAQTCLDMGFSFDVKNRGWRLLYDPEIIVDHYPAKRFDADQRGKPSLEAAENTSFNFYLTLLRHMRPGWKRRMALFWATSVGVGVTPGLLRSIAWRLRGQRDKLALRAAAKRAWAQARRVAMSE